MERKELLNRLKKIAKVEEHDVAGIRCRAYKMLDDDDTEALNTAIDILKRRNVAINSTWKFSTHYKEKYRVCTSCGSERKDDRSTGWNFCPVCGAYMGEDE